MAALVDKSLVIKDDVGGVACYRLHETMREYSGLKLRESAEEDLLDESYVAYYTVRCVQAEDDARHRTQEWLQWVELEIDNIRSALQKCLAASDWRRGLELACLGRLLLGRRVGPPRACAGSTNSSPLPPMLRTSRPGPITFADG